MLCAKSGTKESIIRSGSKFMQAAQAITSSLDQIALITDESRSHDTKQLCEIQCEVTEFSEEHKLLGDIN